MEQLINWILKAGGQRKRLEVKVFGGGNVLPSVIDIGQRNIAFVLACLRTEGLRMAASDVGGPYPRRINYYPATGRVDRKRLPAVAVSEIAGRERSYEVTLRTTGLSGKVDLF
jgi:chemotaxis protein CheD